VKLFPSVLVQDVVDQIDRHDFHGLTGGKRQRSRRRPIQPEVLSLCCPELASGIGVPESRLYFKAHGHRGRSRRRQPDSDRQRAIVLVGLIVLHAERRGHIGPRGVLRRVLARDDEITSGSIRRAHPLDGVRLAVYRYVRELGPIRRPRWHDVGLAIVG
jgi:hypothetical protein